MKTDNLIDYVIAHSERGECNCGRCLDRGDKPDPTGHVCDVGFFKVAARDNPNADELKRLTAKHHGDFAQMDPFDGNLHSFIEVGAWIGDQGLAMQFMALAALLGLGGVMVTENGPVFLPPALAKLMSR